MSSFLITGCARGLGLALVKELASRPRDQVSLVIATTRSNNPGSDLTHLINASGGLIHHAQMNVADPSSINQAAQAVSVILGDSRPLDYLINNAAIREPQWQRLEEMTHLRECMDVNVHGTHATIAAFLPLMKPPGGARKIVLFSSTLGTITLQRSDLHIQSVNLPAYKISKAGTHMLTALWSRYLAEEGFCVYMQSPGNLKTELSGGDRSDLHAEVGAKEVVRIALEAGPEDTGRHRNIYVKGWENGGGWGGRYDGKDLEW